MINQARKPLSATLPYFGGKRTLAPRIIEQFGPHKAYAELCLGSGAVLMNKPEASMEIANDLYGHVINLNRVLASDRYVELAERCQRTLMHDEIFLEAKSHSCDDLDDAMVPPDFDGEITREHVEAAYWYVVMAWQGRNGSAGTGMGNQQICTRYTSNGGSGGLRWAQVGNSIPAWHERLRRVQFKRMDTITLAQKIDDTPDWVLYVDPPYIEKGSKYVHDFVPEDHKRLADSLNARARSRVIVSYYEHPDLDELYPHDRWTRVSLPMNKGLVNAAARGKTGGALAPEILLINGESLEQTLFEMRGGG